MSRHEKERQFKGVWIPAEIWLDGDLTLNEKAILTEIDSFSGPDGCFASNKHFGDFIKLSPNRCSTIISDLEKKGKITVHYTYQPGTKKIAKRFLKTVKKFNEKTPSVNGSTPSEYRNTPSEYGNTPSGNAKGTNTTDTNTRITNTKERVSILFMEYSKGDKELLDHLLAFETMRRVELKSALNETSAKLFLERLDTISLNNSKNKVSILSTSIINNWKSIYKPESKYGNHKKTSSVQPIYNEPDRLATEEEIKLHKKHLRNLTNDFNIGEQ